MAAVLHLGFLRSWLLEPFHTKNITHALHKTAEGSSKFSIKYQVIHGAQTVECFAII